MRTRMKLYSAHVTYRIKDLYIDYICIHTHMTWDYKTNRQNRTNTDTLKAKIENNETGKFLYSEGHDPKRKHECIE